MTKNENQDVIDLGAASAETKGVMTVFQADDALQHKPNAGLSQD